MHPDAKRIGRKIRELANELVRLNVDVIVSPGCVVSLAPHYFTSRIELNSPSIQSSGYLSEASYRLLLRFGYLLQVYWNEPLAKPD